MVRASVPADVTSGSRGLEWAMARLRQAIEVAPWDLHARFLLAKTLERLGHVEEALAVLIEIIRLDPNNLPARRAIRQLRAGGRERKDD